MCLDFFHWTTFFKPYMGSNLTSPCGWNCIHRSCKGSFSGMQKWVTEPWWNSNWLERVKLPFKFTQSYRSSTLRMVRKHEYSKWRKCPQGKIKHICYTLLHTVTLENWYRFSIKFFQTVADKYERRSKMYESQREVFVFGQTARKATSDRTAGAIYRWRWPRRSRRRQRFYAGIFDIGSTYLQYCPCGSLTIFLRNWTPSKS